MSGVVLRQATVNDIDALLALESACFDTDRLSRRNFQWMIRRAHASLVLAESQGRLAGYILVLFHEGTALGRIYSVAVDPARRGQGIAEQLLLAAEQAAREADCAHMRLEVRPDNRAAIRLYEKHGYRQFGIYRHFYEDETDALRFEKRIVRMPSSLHHEVPHCAQTTGFTCGPAALIMAMRALRPDMPLDEGEEFRLWRESTTVFMTSGHGGCSPRGLALSAWRRGFDVDLYINTGDVLFLDGVRDENKKRVITLVHNDFEQELVRSGVRVWQQAASLPDLRTHLEAGALALVLISHYRFSRSKAPHWILVTAIDDHFIYLHDPEIDVEQHKSLTDSMHVPVRHDSFLKMSRYGQSGLRAAVVVGLRAS